MDLVLEFHKVGSFFTTQAQPGAHPIVDHRASPGRHTSGVGFYYLAYGILLEKLAVAVKFSLNYGVIIVLSLKKYCMQCTMCAISFTPLFLVTDTIVVRRTR